MKSCVSQHKLCNIFNSIVLWLNDKQNREIIGLRCKGSKLYSYPVDNVMDDVVKKILEIFCLGTEKSRKKNIFNTKTTVQ